MARGGKAAELGETAPGNPLPANDVIKVSAAAMLLLQQSHPNTSFGWTSRSVRNAPRKKQASLRGGANFLLYLSLGYCSPAAGGRSLQKIGLNDGFSPCKLLYRVIEQPTAMEEDRPRRLLHYPFAAAGPWAL